MCVITSPDGPTVSTVVFLGSWTDLLLPVGLLVVAGLVVFAVVAVGKR